MSQPQSHSYVSHHDIVDNDFVTDVWKGTDSYSALVVKPDERIDVNLATSNTPGQFDHNLNYSFQSNFETYETGLYNLDFHLRLFPSASTPTNFDFKRSWTFSVSISQAFEAVGQFLATNVFQGDRSLVVVARQLVRAIAPRKPIQFKINVTVNVSPQSDKMAYGAIAFVVLQRFSSYLGGARDDAEVNLADCYDLFQQRPHLLLPDSAHNGSEFDPANFGSECSFEMV